MTNHGDVNDSRIDRLNDSVKKTYDTIKCCWGIKRGRQREIGKRFRWVIPFLVRVENLQTQGRIPGEKCIVEERIEFSYLVISEELSNFVA